MKVAIFCDLLPTLLNLRGRLVRAISDVADEVVVTANPAESHLIARLKNELGAEFVPIEMDRCKINPVRDYSYYRNLIRFIKNVQPDCSFSYQPKANVYSSIAARSFPELRTNVLFAGLGYLFSDEGGVKDKLVRRMSRTMYRFAFKEVDHFFLQNPDDLNTLKSKRIIPAQAKATVVNGSGVPLDWYEMAPPVFEPVRFLFMGRLLWDKGIGEFFDAARQLSKKWGAQVEFQMLGPVDSNPFAITQSDLDRRCRESQVKYLGATDDVRPYLREASVFVLPSFYMEGTPRSILEAMAMGRPVITTDSRGCREPITDGENGFLVEPRNPDSLAVAMTRIIENRDLIRTMGVAGRKVAETRYDVELVNRSMLQAMGLVDGSATV